MSIADELLKLEELRQSGSLSEDEYARAKETVLQEGRATPLVSQLWDPITGNASLDERTRLWAMLLHLSVFSGYVIPVAGFVVPILIWQIMKKDLPELDDHGKIVVNWMISSIIYAIVSVVLAFVVIGIPLLIALLIVGIVFPIIGGIKANNGEKWNYPMSITFL